MHQVHVKTLTAKAVLLDADGFSHKVVMVDVEDCNMLNKKKAVSIIVMLSRLSASIVISTMCFTISYFIFTIFILHYFRKNSKLSVNTIATTITIGCILLEIPVRFFDFNGTLFTLTGTICTIAAIILATLSYVEKRKSVYVLSFIILFFLSSYVQFSWVDFCNHCLKTNYKEVLKF